MNKHSLIPIVAVVFALTNGSCDSNWPTMPDGSDQGPSFSRARDSGIDTGLRQAMGEVNAQLEASDQHFRVELAEWLAAPGSEIIGRTVYFSHVGNKQLGTHFVPGDPRRGGYSDIKYIQDLTEAATASGLTNAQTTAAINSAMATWNSVTCSEIPITDLGGFPLDLGVVQSMPGFGGNPSLFTDIMHAGWLPRGFFDLLYPPDGGDFVLGVTFTFIWVTGVNSEPTDIDNNRKRDVAFREIYYNDAFYWAIDADPDVETVALHEAGHGLSQAHFGKLFSTDANGVYHFAPQALMNAGYTGVQQSLLGSDEGGHCSIWASWPNN